VVERNDDYWQEGLPYLDQITFRPIPDEDTRTDSLASRDIDALQTLRQSTVVSTRDLDGVDRYERLGNNSGGNIINTTEPPYDDVRVRRAMALALDQDGLIEVLGGAGVTPTQTQFFSPDSPFYSEEAAEAWPTNDPAAAIEAYQSYVDDPERSDGESPGTGLAIDYDCPPDPSLNELAQLYQAYWTAVGFEVTLNQVEQATHVDEALAKDYEVKCFRVGNERDPYFTLSDAFTEGVLNFTGFQDPRIDDALDVLRTTVEVDERIAAVDEIAMVVAEEVPLTFSGSTLMIIAVREEVKNVDGWTFPDGSEGSGNDSATSMWGHVWLAE
jgi:peptide/nickel transport system substrate-binding protein